MVNEVVWLLLPVVVAVDMLLCDTESDCVIVLVTECDSVCCGLSENDRERDAVKLIVTACDPVIDTELVNDIVNDAVPSVLRVSLRDSDRLVELVRVLVLLRGWVTVGDGVSDSVRVAVVD